MSGFKCLTKGSLLYSAAACHQYFVAFTLLRLTCMVGLNFAASCAEVVFLKYKVAELFAPISMPLTSLIDMCLMASMNIGSASLAAFSAARFSERITLS